MLGPLDHFLCRTKLFAFFAFVLNDQSHYVLASLNSPRQCFCHMTVFQLVLPKCSMFGAMPERAPQLWPLYNKNTAFMHFLQIKINVKDLLTT